MNFLLKKVEQIFSWLAMVLFAGIFLVYVANIFLRYSFAYNLDWADDIIRLFFVWDVFLGTAVMYARKEHLVMEFAVKKMGEKAKERLTLVHDVFQVVFLGVLIWKGFYMTGIRMGISFTAIESLPTGYAYAALPVAAIFMLAVSINNIAGRTTAKRLTLN
jgi:TRAP-type C4-dicarboxylate transport system permease small subunit